MSNRHNILQVYQRQMSKEGLQKVIQKEQIDLPMQQVVIDRIDRPPPSILHANFVFHFITKMQGNTLSSEDLRDLFTLHENVRYGFFFMLTATVLPIKIRILKF